MSMCLDCLPRILLYIQWDRPSHSGLDIQRYSVSMWWSGRNYYGQWFPFVGGLEVLREKYKITHMRISSGNSQVNGLIEQRHSPVREVLFKVCGGYQHWWALDGNPWHVFWAQRVLPIQGLVFCGTQCSSNIAIGHSRSNIPGSATRLLHDRWRMVNFPSKTMSKAHRRRWTSNAIQDICDPMRCN